MIFAAVTVVKHGYALFVNRLYVLGVMFAHSFCQCQMTFAHGHFSHVYRTAAVVDENKVVVVFAYVLYTVEIYHAAVKTVLECVYIIAEACGGILIQTAVVDV